MTRRFSYARYFLVFISIVCGSFGVFSAAQAQTLPQNSVIVRPAKAEVIISAGEERSVVFKVSNGTREPLHASVSFEDIVANNQESAVDDAVRLLGDAKGANSLKDALSVTQTSFDILTGQEVSVPVTIHIPKSAEPGSRYGSVVFRFSKLSATGNTGADVSLDGRIAALLYVRIAGEVREEGRLVAFGLFNNAKTTKSPTIDEPLRMQVAYQNTGTVYLNPYGRATIRSIFGGTHVLPIDPWAVLPLATRMREIDMTESLNPGLYTAHLELNRGYKDVVDEQEVYFVVLPTPIGWLISLAVLLLIVWVLRRSLQLSRHTIS
jgi:hypothetical protein